MEWWEVAKEFITGVGFPIAVAVYLLYQNKYEADKHDNEVKILQASLEKNTLAINTLCERLDKEK